MLVITHELAVARRLATRVAVMHGGVVVEEGPADIVLHRPSTPYAQELVASVARTTLRSRRRRASATFARSAPRP
jgi:peptide/nickel transport system ATP-binding protein